MADDDLFMMVTVPSALGITMARMCKRCGALIADDPAPQQDVPEGAITPAKGHRGFHESLDRVVTMLTEAVVDHSGRPHG